MKLDNIHKSFGGSKILNGISLEIESGKNTVIMGPNGCGKSTLMNIICGIENVDSGRVINRPEKIGYVFQDYKRTLLPWFSVEENIMFPLTAQNVPREKAKKQLNKLLALIPLSFPLDQKVHGLSGGQAQMVTLLRALILEPDLLILDEPFAALDYRNTLLFMERILSIKEQMDMTMISICHDLDQAIFLGDRVIALSQCPTTVVHVRDIVLPERKSVSVLGSGAFAHEKADLLPSIQQTMTAA